MKKAFAVIGSLCLLAAPIGLTACGSDEAKIYGIHAAVVSPENDYAFSRALADETTLFEDDYILQNGQTYHLSVGYSASGGSKYPIMSADKIKLYYDDDALEIEQASKNKGEVIRYRVTCKKAVVNTAVIVEVDEYSYTVIISAQ